MKPHFNLNRYVIAGILILLCSNAVAKDCVVLLHGLVRSASAMDKLAKRFLKEGYIVSNINYPSRKYSIEKLAELAIGESIQQCKKKSASSRDEIKASKINFVTHSLGGILVRVYLKKHILDNINRVVMLGPPNQGSEVVDTLKDLPGFELLNGPAGMQLGTKDTDIPRSLGPVNFEVGVIAGTQSMNLILSLFLPGKDDGKVTVEAAKVKGMKNFVTLPTMHPFMMKSNRVIEQAVYFIKYGKFFIAEKL